MIQILTILIFGSLLVREELHPLLVDILSPSVAATLTLLPILTLVAAMLAICWGCRMELERRGTHMAVVWADRAISAARWGGVLWHLVGVLALGWLDAVRAVTGDLILVDELIAAAPPLLVFLAGWWAIYPIDRLLRDATLIGALDQGRPVHAPLSRWQFVSQSARHQLLIVLVPIVVLAGWSESMDLLMVHLRGGPGFVGAWLESIENRRSAHSVLQLLGVAAVFSFMPPVMRFLWDTARLPDGETRERLMGLCQNHGVRVRELLIWRTRGVMLNGAVMGLFPGLRYVLLTDALLERLPQEQVEAVMAHEIGHVRRRHVPWLAASLLASVGIPIAGVDMLAIWANNHPGFALGETVWWPILQLLLLLGSVAAGLALFGWISRRFEWQADAFAAQHLSGIRTRRGQESSTPGTLIAPEAATAMAGALDAVARLNHIPRRKFSWRHGSIQRRIDNLNVMVGQPALALKIDRHAGLIKLCVGASVVVLAILIAKGY